MNASECYSRSSSAWKVWPCWKCCRRAHWASPGFWSRTLRYVRTYVLHNKRLTPLFIQGDPVPTAHSPTITYALTHTYTHTHTYVHTYVHTYIHTHIHTHFDSHIYTHTHTHTPHRRLRSATAVRARTVHCAPGGRPLTYRSACAFVDCRTCFISRLTRCTCFSALHTVLCTGSLQALLSKTAEESVFK
jgi:hypothetical protein